MLRIPLFASLLLIGCTDGPIDADPCAGLPLDADGDGICDGADPCPLDAENDSDGDGVCDAEDPCPADPADDSDGDGVCDGVDLCPGEDDGADVDGDEVPDACDPCPENPDVREGDGPCDEDAGEAPCAYVDVPLPGMVQAPGVFTPEYLGVTWGGVVNGSGFEDYVRDGTPESAWLEFSFYDANFAYQCSVVYDLSRPGASMPSSAPWTQAAPVPLFEAWELYPSHGETDCGEVSHPSFPEHADARSLIESVHWAIGIGPMHDLDDHMQVDPAYAASWATDYAPYLTSGYVSYHGHAPIESNYVFGYERVCDTWVADPVTGGPVPVPAPIEGPLADAYESHVYYLLPL